MRWRPSIRIDKVDNLEVSFPPGPFRERAIRAFLRSFEASVHDALPAGISRTEPPPTNSPWVNRIEIGAKLASIISGIAAAVFVGLLWAGQTSIGGISIKNALTILSVALVGGLVSVGGVKLFSINASLRRAIAAASDCPFIPIFQRAIDTDGLRQPGNPYVCQKCPLGVDTNSNVPGGLMHNCRVYPIHHARWLELPGAREQMRQ